MDNSKEGGTINDRHEKIYKSIAFISNTDEEVAQCEMDTDEASQIQLCFLIGSSTTF